jgi:hypothetical protein
MTAAGSKSAARADTAWSSSSDTKPCRAALGGSRTARPAKGNGAQCAGECSFAYLTPWGHPPRSDYCRLHSTRSGLAAGQEAAPRQPIPDRHRPPQHAPRGRSSQRGALPSSGGSRPRARNQEPRGPIGGYFAQRADGVGSTARSDRRQGRCAVHRLPDTHRHRDLEAGRSLWRCTGSGRNRPGRGLAARR